MKANEWGVKEFNEFLTISAIDKGSICGNIFQDNILNKRDAEDKLNKFLKDKLVEFNKRFVDTEDPGALKKAGLIKTEEFKEQILNKQVFLFGFKESYVKLEEILKLLE